MLGITSGLLVIEPFECCVCCRRICRIDMSGKAERPKLPHRTSAAC